MLKTEPLRYISSNIYYKSIFGIILLASLAQIQIPIQPVPVTLHTVGAVLIGLMYSPREAISSWGGYLLLGLMGLPIFTGYNSGIEKLIGPSSGYYCGMMLGSCSAAFVKEKFSLALSRMAHLVFLSFLVQFFTYLVGVFVLGNFIGFDKAIFSGFIVFIPSGIAKIFIISLLFKMTYARHN